uniref:SJCHGC09496 protein n=1 Tax=Schistosoma japonicum TaxID=6182 RepID=Q5DEE0_SCHJA|nr:SJCHGC09496 protein [Schistosoma japonicum]
MITPSDDSKQVKLVIRVRISVIIFWLLSIVFLIIGITVLSMYHNLNDSSQYAGTIAGTFFLVLSVPLIICSSCLTSALLIIQESIQDERDYRCRDPEFYKDIPYPRQPFKPVPSTSLLPTPYPSAPLPLFQGRPKLFLPTDQQYGVASPPSYHSAVSLIN